MDILLVCCCSGRRSALLGGCELSNHRDIPGCLLKGGDLMDVFQFIQIVGFGLAFFMAGYNIRKRK